MAVATQTWVNGKPAVSLALPDRGLDYGDGLFETMLVQEGCVPWLQYHVQRLQDGMLRLGFDSACSGAAKGHIASALGHSRISGIMRLTVTRGGGPRGYAPAESAEPNYIIQLHETDDAGQPRLAPARVGRSGVTLSIQPLLAGIKHLNRLEQVLAARERQLRGLDEMLLLDTKGNVISVISGNIFLVKGNQLLTPCLDECGILGTRRRLMLDELGPYLGLECRETSIGEGDLALADEVFYCNSVRGFQPFGSYRDHCWSQHSIVEQIQSAYRQRLSSCDA